MPTRRQFVQSALFLPAALTSANAFAQDTPKTDAAQVFADFESGDYDGWTIEGDAFGTAPATDATFPGKIRGFTGRGFLCSLHQKKGNAATGKAISKEFTIEKPFLTFKIGGGNHPNQACLNLIVDNQIVRTATGDGTATLSESSFDVSNLLGRKAHIEIVDATASADRGYIMVDDIHFTDASPDMRIEGALQDALPEILEGVRQKYRIPAMFVAVGYRGQIRALHCSGVRKLGYDSPVTLHDKVLIGSISKTCIAIVVGNVVAEGAIRMNSTIGEVLPDLRDVIHSSYRDATVSQLLKHTAGLGKDVGIPWGLKAGAQKYRYTFAVNLLKLPPVAPVGQFSYSSGMEVVAVMLERVTGQTYESLLSRYVFQPCGMKSAYMGRPYEDGSKTGRLDQTWGHLEKNGKITPFLVEWNTHMFCAAGGGIACEIADLCRFGNGLYPGLRGQQTPLGRQALRLICGELGWGQGDFTTNGSSCGDYSTVRILTNSSVIAVHSTARLEHGEETPNYELIQIIQNKIKSLV
jgi:CubicO group peptidase (beta-lactamase class C family)